MPTLHVQAHFKTINVAVAVIHYQAHYLLGFRNEAQHQGNRYEFVGGKIESGETAISALIREVAEETGMDIRDNTAVKLGRLHHDYGDKKVCLQVYQIELSAFQFEEYRHISHGLEGQVLSWVPKDRLLAGDYPLPAANQTILAWLQLPTHIVITYPLAHFEQQENAADAWLNYHQQHLPQDAWVSMRIKASSLNIPNLGLKNHTNQPLASFLIEQLNTARSDIYNILPSQSIFQKFSQPILQSIPQIITEQNYNQNSEQPSVQAKAIHLTHNQLMHWFSTTADSDIYCSEKGEQYFIANQPLILSCHDAESIHAANQLASYRLYHQQPPVIGVFLSPVLATQSHPNDTPLGWEAWASLAQLADMPVIALGGLSPELYEFSKKYGATMVAGIRAFMKP